MNNNQGQCDFLLPEALPRSATFPHQVLQFILIFGAVRVETRVHGCWVRFERIRSLGDIFFYVRPRAKHVRRRMKDQLALPSWRNLDEMRESAGFGRRDVQITNEKNDATRTKHGYGKAGLNPDG